MEHNCEDWMSSLPEELWDIPLTHLAIPGTYGLYLHVSPHNTHTFYRQDTKIELKTMHLRSDKSEHL